MNQCIRIKLYDPVYACWDKFFTSTQMSPCHFPAAGCWLIKHSQSAAPSSSAAPPPPLQTDCFHSICPPVLLHCEFLFIAGATANSLHFRQVAPDWNVAVRRMHNCHFPPLVTFHRANVAVPSPKLQNFQFNFEKPGYYSTGLKNHCFGRTFLENIWDLVKSFCCIGIPGEILFQSCSGRGNLFHQHSVTDKEGSNAESTKVTCFCHHLRGRCKIKKKD